MAVTSKKLFQGFINNAANVVTVAKAPTDSAIAHTEITSIWAFNSSLTEVRIITMFAHGTGASDSNILTTFPPLAPRTGTLLTVPGSPIILPAGDTLRLSQDAGSDVVITAYGIEEV